MKQGGGRQKGRRNESQIARILQEWWGDGEFHRTPASGGLRWKSEHRIHGDLACPPSFPWKAPELKHREDWNIDSVLAGKVTPSLPFVRYWQDAIDAAKRAKSAPILFLRRNHFGILVVMEKRLFSSLEQRCGPFLRPRLDITIPPKPGMTAREVTPTNYKIVTVTRWETFKDWAQPSILKRSHDLFSLS